MSGMKSTNIAIVIIVAGALATSAVLWFSLRPAAAVREQVLDLPMICASCKHTFCVDYEGLLALAREAREKGLKGVGEERNPMVGICPKCGKPTVCRAEEDARTGQLSVPDEVTKTGDDHAIKRGTSSGN